MATSRNGWHGWPRFRCRRAASRCWSCRPPRACRSPDIEPASGRTSSAFDDARRLGRCSRSRRCRARGISSIAVTDREQPRHRRTVRARWRRTRRRAGRAGRRAPAAGRRCRRCGAADRSYKRPPLNMLKRSAAAKPASDLSQAALRSRPRAAGGRARRFRRAGRGQGYPSRPGRDAVRVRAGAGHQVLARDRAGRRHRPLHERRIRARRGRARPQRHRHRAAQRAPRDGLPARAVRDRTRSALADAALPLVLGKGISGDAGLRRSGAHAASAGGRHHRLGQVGRRQRHDPVAAATGCRPSSAAS